MPIRINLGPTVAALSSESVTRRRVATPTIDAAGHVVAGATSDTAIKCVMQRPGPDALNRLAEGLRSRARWLMHTTADIRGGSQASSGGRSATMPDLIVYGGVTYTAADITDQSAHGQFRRVVLLDGVT